MPEADPLGHIYLAIKDDKPYYELVAHFYTAVAKDTLLRPLYPDDLILPQEHLALFLIQRTGGHATYSNERGHPRMRARHLPFKIGVAEKEAWLRHMKGALEQVPEFAQHKGVLFEFFENFAAFLVNQPA